MGPDPPLQGMWMLNDSKGKTEGKMGKMDRTQCLPGRPPCPVTARPVNRGARHQCWDEGASCTFCHVCQVALRAEDWGRLLMWTEWPTHPEDWVAGRIPLPRSSGLLCSALPGFFQVPFSVSQSVCPASSFHLAHSPTHPIGLVSLQRTTGFGEGTSWTKSNISVCDYSLQLIKCDFPVEREK